jgi:L,D-transpeptidase catalytic domain
VPSVARSPARMPVRRFLVAVLAGGLPLCAPAQSGAIGPAPLAGAGSGAAPVVVLSNLRTLSRWTYPRASIAVHEDPSASSRVVGRTHFLTSDGQAQPYLALRAETLGPVTWILLSLPGRPNGSAGWVPADGVGDLYVSRESLRVNRATLHAVLYRAGRAIWSAPVGVGRASAPTPAGHFYITEKLTPLGEAAYGPYALGTSAYSPTLSDWPGGGVVGIHGTDEPQLIPGRPSHGCIRLRNGDVTSLWRLIEIGTPLEIV